MSSRSRLFLKALFGALAVVGFICVSLIGSLESGGNSATPLTTTTKQTATTNLRHTEAALISGDAFIHHPELDLKRRIPNGPDPVHNRRAGNSGRPPGQS